MVSYCFVAKRTCLKSNFYRGALPSKSNVCVLVLFANTRRVPVCPDPSVQFTEPFTIDPRPFGGTSNWITLRLAPAVQGDPPPLILAVKLGVSSKAELVLEILPPGVFA